MKIRRIIISAILITSCPLYSGNSEFNVEIDTSRFQLKTVQSNYLLEDNLRKTMLYLNSELLANPEEEDEEKTYVSSFNFSKKVNSFDIGNGLIGIQISSFSAMNHGSAQAAEGRDVFLVFNPKTNSICNKILDFGITKQRSRYMGCLSAKTSHFILADVDGNGMIDIGCIKEELKCVETSDSMGEPNVISGPFFFQESVNWYVFGQKFWIYDSSQNDINSYVDLPLIGIKLNPIDYFGFIKWESYDPKNWDQKSDVTYYPLYRLHLINNN